MENLENYYGRLLTENQMNSDLKKQAKILPAMIKNRITLSAIVAAARTNLVILCRMDLSTVELVLSLDVLLTGTVFIILSKSLFQGVRS